MPENMMNSDHKAVSDSYRENYDRIKWERDKPDCKVNGYEIPHFVFSESQKQVVYGPAELF